MSYSNNTRSLVNTKLTDKGREKIALGNLNLKSWALGDSEINYVREDFNVDNEIENKPARILKAVNQQPNIKYHILTSDDVIKHELTNNNISVRKINLVGEKFTTDLLDSAYFNTEGITLTNSGNDYYTTVSGINNEIVINDSYMIVKIFNGVRIVKRGRIIGVTFNNSVNTTTIRLEGVSDSELNGGDIFLFKNIVPSLNPSMNTNTEFNWSNDILSYNLNQQEVGETKVWDFNILTYEDLAGMVGKENTYGYEFIGFMENYLSYNDNMNTETIFDDEDNCGEDSIIGQKDSFQKMIGILHFTNNNHANLYGDSFLIDQLNDRGVILTPNIRSQYGDLKNGDVLKNILDSDILYYDLIANNTDEVVGKILPQFKMVVIENNEILAALSFHSGRDYTLPMIKSQLVNTSEQNALILPDGKQIYITYNFDTNQYYKLRTIHSLEYNVLKNKTKVDKFVQISFDSADFINLFQNQTNNDGALAKINGLNVIYQITNIGERPNPLNWMIHNMSPTLNLLNQQPVQNYNKIFNSTVKLIGLTNSTQYNLREYLYPISPKVIGDDLWFDGVIKLNYTSAVYQSLITININPNLFTKTLNPTYMDVEGVKPYIVLSEIGLYDSDNELVMIAKLTRPITFVTNSAIRIEFGLDF